ncbi:InlB B-repeat-containing protein, partial [Candidatus Saccharibacteria bacterium]|nr:InlB B-repeat-containing protein [Candidatus Saccharibacteria bacterium]
MWKKIFAASAVAVGVAGILGSGSAFASYIVSDSYTPGLGLPISGDNDVCVRKSGGYDGDLIVADIRGTNYEKQVVFDHFAEDRICVSVDSVPESSNLKFVVPMGLGDMSYTLSGDNGQNRVILDLSDATSVNKYVRSYGNTTTRTAKSVATITLDTNGGTGIVPVITGIEIGSSVTLPNITLTRTGYNFAGWNTKADGTGTPYSNGATIPVAKAGELVLFAQWQGRAVLDRGEVVNGRLKHLAGTEAASGVSIVYQNDYNIKAIKKASALPEGFNTSSAANIISASTATSPERIYAWYDNSDGDNDGDGDGAIYIFSGADIIEAGSDMSYMFENMRSLSDISAVSDWDTSAAENMTGVFIGDSSLSNIDAVASWNTSNVYTLSAIFMSTNFANADALRTMRHESK